jgi:hypothetical protein
MRDQSLRPRFPNYSLEIIPQPKLVIRSVAEGSRPP